MKYILLLAPLLFFSGCGAVGQTTFSVTEPPIETPPSNEASVYTNDRFGFSFEIPESFQVFALTPEQTAVEATADSDLVFLVEEESNFFTIRGIKSTQSAHEWLTQNLAFFYLDGQAGQRVGEIDGHQAIFLTGSGTSSSPARVILIQLSERFLIVTFEKESAVFEALLESLHM